jgi:anti-sigma B factor antagonist
MAVVNGFGADSGRHTLAVQDAVSEGRHTLVLTGELDVAFASDLEQMVTRLCASGVRGVALDLSKLTFVDSTGIRAILRAQAVCREHGYDFLIEPGRESVQRVFELTGLLDVLPFAHSDGAQA